MDMNIRILQHGEFVSRKRFEELKAQLNAEQLELQRQKEKCNKLRKAHKKLVQEKNQIEAQMEILNNFIMRGREHE